MKQSLPIEDMFIFLFIYLLPLIGLLKVLHQLNKSLPPQSLEKLKLIHYFKVLLWQVATSPYPVLSHPEYSAEITS